MKIETIQTADGAMDLHIAEPAGAPRGAMVVIPEAFGVNRHIEDVCNRLAAEGYLAVAPEIFHRTGKNVLVDYDDLAKVMPILGSLDNRALSVDVAAALAFVRARVTTKVGIVGFCVGGFAAFLAAETTDVDAAVCFYGGGIVKVRPGIGLSPLLGDVAGIRCPLVLFFGDQDKGIPREQVDEIAKRLTDAEKRFDLTIYEGAGHGFFRDDHAAYHDRAAKDAWKKTLAFLGASISA